MLLQISRTDQSQSVTALSQRILLFCTVVTRNPLPDPSPGMQNRKLRSSEAEQTQQSHLFLGLLKISTGVCTVVTVKWNRQVASTQAGKIKKNRRKSATNPKSLEILRGYPKHPGKRAARTNAVNAAVLAVWGRREGGAGGWGLGGGELVDSIFPIRLALLRRCGSIDARTAPILSGAAHGVV